jgi:ABC-2 type transport system permease protein
MGAAFISLGIFASSITENQIVAAVLSFGSLLIFFMMGYSASFAGESVGSILKYLSFMPHLYNFAKGVLDTEDIMYYFLFILFCIFLNMRTLESKRWRG